MLQIFIGEPMQISIFNLDSAWVDLSRHIFQLNNLISPWNLPEMWHCRHWHFHEICPMKFQIWQLSPWNRLGPTHLGCTVPKTSWNMLDRYQMQGWAQDKLETETRPLTPETEKRPRHWPYQPKRDRDEIMVCPRQHRDVLYFLRGDWLVKVHTVLIAVIQLYFMFINSSHVNMIINYRLAMSNCTHISIPVCYMCMKQGLARDVASRDWDIGYTSRNETETLVHLETEMSRSGPPPSSIWNHTCPCPYQLHSKYCRARNAEYYRN